MLPEHETLIAIQERDRRVQDLQRSIDRIPEERDLANYRLKDDQEKVSAAKAKTDEHELAIKNLELDIQTRRDSIGKLKTQQFETKKNEEFRAMGHEIERYDKEVTELEDKELELMEELEALKATLEEAKSGLAKTQELVDEEHAALDERQENAQKQIEELRVELSSLKEKVDGTQLDLYERLFASKGDFAIVPVNNGVCGGCHMKIPPDNIHRAEHDKTLVSCVSCGRIIYVP